MMEAAASVSMSREVGGYLMSIVEGTRKHPALLLGVSPRGALHLAKLAKASAALDGRDYLLPDDVKDVAIPCLSHRITPKSEASLRGKTRREIIAQVLEETPVPVKPYTSTRDGQ